MSAPQSPVVSDESHVKTTNKVSVQESDNSDTRHINQYLVKNKIGEGAFGTVYQVVDAQGKPFAMKEINKRRIQRKSTFSSGGGTPGGSGGSGRLGVGGPGPRAGLRRPPSAGLSPAAEDPWDMIKREIAIMKKLKHKHVIMLQEVLDDDEVDCLYMGKSFHFSISISISISFCCETISLTLPSGFSLSWLVGWLLVCVSSLVLSASLSVLWNLHSDGNRGEGTYYGLKS